MFYKNILNIGNYDGAEVDIHIGFWFINVGIVAIILVAIIRGM